MKEVNAEIQIVRMEEQSAVFYVLGKSPIILHRMSEKARHELLAPRGRMTAASKATNLKHDPLAEFRAAAHIVGDGPTLLAFPSSGFKRALSSAALDIPGAKKAQIGRLTYVKGEYVGIYGIPKLLMSVTRSADMNRTPDIRTRVIVPNWAAVLEISFVKGLLNTTSVANLLVAAGLYNGVGDWRPQKGAGSYGQFTLTAPDDADLQVVMQTAGRDAQKEAMANPESYDIDTEEMLAWYVAEISRRGLKTEKAATHE